MKIGGKTKESSASARNHELLSRDIAVSDGTSDTTRGFYSQEQNYCMVTRVPNSITEGRALPVNEIGIAIEVFQIAYIAMTAIILVKERGGRGGQTIKEKR